MQGLIDTSFTLLQYHGLLGDCKLQYLDQPDSPKLLSLLPVLIGRQKGGGELKLLKTAGTWHFN